MALVKCLVFLTVLARGAAAQSLASVLTDAPQCAADCLITIFSQPAFAGKNQSAICGDKQFADAIGDCLTAKCTVRQTLDFIKISAAVCGLEPTNNILLYRLVTIIMAVCAFLFFTLRIIATVRLKLKWALDDTLTTASFVLMIPTVVLLQFMINNGLGLDIWYLSDYEITEGFRLFFFLELVYLASLVLVKTAILCFFLRIFPDNKFRIVTKFTIAFNILIGVTFFILAFFQTQPLSFFWQGWQTKESKRVMTGIIRLTMPHAALNLALDVWMLVLPISQLWGVGLKFKKKLGVIAMFSVGIFLTIVAAIRVHELVLFASSRDLTVINAQKAMIWSSVEICVGVMVACMPHIRNLVRYIRSRHREKKGTGKEPGSEQIFVDRSLATITVDEATRPELNDEGLKSKASRTTTTTSTTAAGTTNSTHTGSISFASDADTQV
ncbi:uncharacterized protein B0J16DRAFT_343669 [Fusarium flagelliforme]|uniref:uncharacterized protein n=1 Tax=Fusarium flagelliforme TaxID=2675880 RepID=UPI001E8D5C57|nr:uncharacterized protein B0J16DRAFT_343669 [Fusarium flagelliforme]KAH7182414.1 hypothetical protein B0J16DRAFT_343669 [Fusarium flagelliforme]